MDFLNRLVGRTLGNVETVRPAIAPRFAVSPVAVGSDLQIEEETTSTNDSTATTPATSPRNIPAESSPIPPSPAEVMPPQIEDSSIERREQQTASTISPPSVVREVTSLNTQTRIEEVTRIFERIETQRIETVLQVGSEPSSLGQQSAPLEIDNAVEQASITSREDRRNRASEGGIEPVVVILQGLDSTTSEQKKRREPITNKSATIEPAQPNLSNLLASIQPAPMDSQPLQKNEPKAPKVNISIGQLEIRVSAPKPPIRPVSRATKVHPQQARASLDNYLKKHT